MEGCIGNSLFANALIAAREKFKVPPDLFANNGNAVEANAEQGINGNHQLTARELENGLQQAQAARGHPTAAATQVAFSQLILDPVIHTDAVVKREQDKESNNESSESGWEFWSRIYERPSSKSKIASHSMKAPTITELLSNKKLIRAQLIFTSVPVLGPTAAQIIRSLIEVECGKNISIFDISATPRRWCVQFLNREEALGAWRIFNGYRFRNRFLVVHYEEVGKQEIPETDKHQANQEKKSKADNLYADIKAKATTDKNVWSDAEKADLEQFKNELIELLEGAKKSGRGVRNSDDRVMHLNACKLPLVEAILKEWPLGMFRMCAPQVRVAGEYLRLDRDNQGWDSEWYSRVYTEGWEPMAPMLIRSDYQLVDYTVALLRKFGTQEMLVGLPWRVLAALLPPGAGWPRDSVLLMKKVARLTPQVVIFDETMFLISDKNHRRELGRKCAEWPYTTSVKLAALCEDGSEQ